jgi:chromosome segregation protein
MRLKTIKLAGFKSFVDPTTAHFPGDMVCVVGPNGCGKSNIIDAVRWVMGESSAKNLRGQAITDVIFSGSSARMPVGQATIELIFDNSNGSLKGEYANYNEISVKRTVNREAKSVYSLNGARCRRRDIQDVFLGTGLGPRSYSIIEQGMISRFVEAKPDELRVYIEEAAGISKYKERRRETENRIRHTKENLERLKDIREELGRQLHHLKRQARSAEQYAEFKQQERLLKAQLLAIRWQGFDEEYVSQTQIIREFEVKLESAHAEQRSIETNIEKKRVEYTQENDQLQSCQTLFYEVSTEIARHEQNIKHQQERAAQLKEDLARTEAAWHSANTDLKADLEKIELLSTEYAEIEPELENLSQKEQASAEVLEFAELKMQQWQQHWDTFNQKAAAPRQRAEVEQTRIRHVEQTIHRLQQRLVKLEEESNDTSSNPEDQALADLRQKIATLDNQVQTHEKNVAELVSRVEQQREMNQDHGINLDLARRERQKLQGRHASLQALQQSALGKTNVPVVQWLEKNRLNNLPRLAQKIQVEKDWEMAVEVILGHYLQAVCVPSVDALESALANFTQGSITLVNDNDSLPGNSDAGTTLLSKIDSPLNLNSLLSGVYVAGTLAEALSLRNKLAAHESVITKNGVWLASGWMRVIREENEQSSVLSRQKDLQSVEAQIADLEEKVERLSVDFKGGLLAIKNLEQSRENSQRLLNGVLSSRANVSAQLSAKEAKIEQVKVRYQRIQSDLEESREQLLQEQARLTEARALWQDCLAAMESDEITREQLLGERDGNRAALDQARHTARHDKEILHQWALRKQSVKTQLDALQQGRDRLQAQVESFSERQSNLRDTLGSSSAPMAELEKLLAVELEKRLVLEEQLSQARKQVEQAQYALSQLEQQRIKIERKVDGARGELEQQKLQWQSSKVQKETLAQQLTGLRQDLQSLLDGLPTDASEPDWEKNLERIHKKIERLGPINLAAIEEYKTQEERKTYLDAQNADLEEALTTLENAIKKIDRETRTKFKETFDKINKGLQDIFPKVFGGGHAYLELTGEDLLQTGVTVMARPPGKRNSSIHLLSGGEKALTAISMVFAIFQLNPAPFCMLDEVDAPLDDANVGRFCRIVKEMSQMVQFIIISHNKVTMEMASHMMGVTMHEPGVSRLVTVNVDEAVELVAV